MQKRIAQLEEENLIQKSDCHLHATLWERLGAIHKLRFQHDIKLLYKVLGVNRSTYYKHFSKIPAPQVKENQNIRRIILQIYSNYNKCLGAYKITYILVRDYGIHISVRRVYRLMNSMDLPKISTDKPRHGKHSDNGECNNHLHRKFNQIVPNLVWASDFTYIKVNGK